MTCWLRLTESSILIHRLTTVFELFFFYGNDPDAAIAIAGSRATFVEDYVREGEFSTLQDALNRLDNIGSRWVMYPNAAITELREGVKTVIGIYMADGISFLLCESPKIVSSN